MKCPLFPWLRAGPQLPEHPLSESSSGRTRKTCQKDSNSWRLLNSAFLTKTKLSKLKVCRFCQDSILPGQELLTSFGIGLPWHGDLSSHLCINVVYHTGLVNRPEMIQRNCYPGSNGKVTIYIQTYFLLMPTKCHFSLTLRIVLGWQERYCVERVTWGFNK